MSRLARALWIEITTITWYSATVTVEARESLVDRNLFHFQSYWLLLSRGSREPCGSKLLFCRISHRFVSSRLARALWIEIVSGEYFPSCPRSRGSREPCGSKLTLDFVFAITFRRGSREPCGSKSRIARMDGMYSLSRLARALWIEISSV
ncbi:Uncharacterised protein [[Clostridium] symbiosum]|nr:Uncharacterised protein [[Clostridium] symbiosum]